MYASILTARIYVLYQEIRYKIYCQLYDQLYIPYLEYAMKPIRRLQLYVLVLKR